LDTVKTTLKISTENKIIATAAPILTDQVKSSGTEIAKTDAMMKKEMEKSVAAGESKFTTQTISTAKPPEVRLKK